MEFSTSSEYGRGRTPRNEYEEGRTGQIGMYRQGSLPGRATWHGSKIGSAWRFRAVRVPP